MSTVQAAPPPQSTVPSMKLPDDVRRLRQGVFEQYARRARGLLHLGAHLGQEAAGYQRFGKPVVWVEGIPSVYEELTRRLQDFPQQRALCALLDEVDGRQRRLHVSNNASGASSSLFDFGPYGRGPQSLWPALQLDMVATLTLCTISVDTLLQANDIDPRAHDLWVVDLQGAELLALKGAPRALDHCRAMLVEISEVAVYDGGVQWNELRDWLQARGFVPLWPPALPHDDVLFVRESALDAVRDDFQSEHYLRHNARRLEHLASLNLPLRRKRVLEVGAGIGDHTSFYLDRGCTVTVTDVRPENLLLLRERFRREPAVTVRPLDMDAPSLDAGERFDVIHCYGLLYHLKDPEGAIRFLARHGDLLVLETCVAADDRSGINPVDEPAETFSQSFHGAGCRPHAQWVLQTLRQHFSRAEITATQPDHPEFRKGAARPPGSLLRRVFVARQNAPGAAASPL